MAQDGAGHMQCAVQIDLPGLIFILLGTSNGRYGGKMDANVR